MALRKADTWLNNLNESIIPYLDGEDYEVRYLTLNPYLMSAQEHRNLQQAAEEICRIMSALAQDIIANGNKSVVDILNMTPEITPFILDDNSPYVSNIARLDFVKESKSGLFKLTEINADTPCGMPEAYYANVVAQQVFAANPDIEDYHEDLAKPFAEILARQFSAADKVNIVCAANKDYLEDWANTAYVRKVVSSAVMNLPQECSVYLADLRELIIKEDGVYITNVLGKEIKADILYRLHPLELLAEDQAEDGYPVGKKLMDLANLGKVVLVNPVKALLLQNKALMAVTRLLAESTDYFAEFDKFIISNHIPDTSLEAEHFKGRKFIKKPIFGREGCNITIVEPDGTFSYEAEESDDCDAIYQEFIESPVYSCETDDGPWEGKLTYSCFVINGKASQVFIRFSLYDIAGTEALCVPVVRTEK